MCGTYGKIVRLCSSVMCVDLLPLLKERQVHGWEREMCKCPFEQHIRKYAYTSCATYEHRKR